MLLHILNRYVLGPISWHESDDHTYEATKGAPLNIVPSLQVLGVFPEAGWQMINRTPSERRFAQHLLNMPFNLPYTEKSSPVVYAL